MIRDSQTRRHFLQTAALAAATPLVRSGGLDRALPFQNNGVSHLPTDSNYWNTMADQYDVDRSVINLENAYWGIMARPVEAAYIERSRFVNRTNVVYVRDGLTERPYTRDLVGVRQRIASALGCTADEIAPTRSGTEALQNLIVNYSKLAPGDGVIYADLDFDAMQFAMEYLAAKRGATVVRFAIPEPAHRSNVLEAYDSVLRTAVRPKLLLLTHVSHRTGLVLPVAEIARMARERGVDVILDAAQSWGQIDFQIGDFDVDFAGFSLHKWIGAPLGTGFLYIKKSRLQNIAPHFDNRDFPADDIRARVLTGTTNFAALLTVPVALDFHLRIGAADKERRLRHLRDYWVTRIRDLKSVEVLTPDDPLLHVGVTSFRIKGKAAIWVQQTLLTKYGIFTAARKGITKGDAVRVTPSLYNREPEVDRLVIALREMSV